MNGSLEKQLHDIQSKTYTQEGGPGDGTTKEI